MTSPNMSPTRVKGIVDVLLTIPQLGDSNARSLYRQEIESILGRTLGIRGETAHPRTDLHDLVRACEREADGLLALATVIEALNDGTKAARDVRRIATEWSFERRLIELLPAELSADLQWAITQVLGNPPKVAPIGLAVQSVGWQPSGRWSGPPLLAIVDILAATTHEQPGLDEWLRDAAAFAGTNLTGLRRRTTEHLQSPHTRHPVKEGDVPRDPPESNVKRIVIEETPAALTPIRGGIPPRNTYFTGRDEILRELQQTLADRSTAAVLPEAALQGAGGVGKTQIAVEYAYRNVDRYQLIWWIQAEDPAAVRASLAELAERLGLPTSGAMDQTVRAVLDALSSTTPMSWLLVYDNADDPASLDGLTPTAHGHVLFTSRNPLWSASGPTVEVDVFSRLESTQLLQRHRPKMTDSEAERLAEQLGDLPLALEQAAALLVTTLSSVDDYLDEFARHKRTLLSEGRPRNYPHTVATFVTLAVARMRQESPAAAQLLEMIAFLAPDPVSSALLWEGRGAETTEPLRAALQERNDIARAMRDLVRFGVAKTNSARQITVHRLVQYVLREELSAAGNDDALDNARRLLAAANPGYPDDRATWPRHAEMRPHARAADLIHGDLRARQAIMDQLRYVFNTGDFEGCAELATEILDAWNKPVDDGGFGPQDPLTLLAMRRYADALRSLGDRDAALWARRALDGSMAALGETHEYTMGAVMGVAADLRIANKFAEARELDDRTLQLHLDTFLPGDPATLRAMNSVAINLRWAGEFQAAYEMDVEAERQSRTALSELAAWTFFAIEGQARDLLLLGRYQDALELQQSSLPEETALLGDRHVAVLRAKILVASMLRKTGRVADAVTAARDTYRSASTRFGPMHGHTLAATVTLANTLRAAGDAAQALTLITDARDGYTSIYGADHGLTLCTAVNEAVIHRALGNDRDALALDEAIIADMSRVLGPQHPFALSAFVNYGSDLSRAHRLDEARDTTEAVWQHSARLRGEHHPYTLHAANNLALDMIACGQRSEGEQLHRSTVAQLEQVYGVGHPEPSAARRYRRLECELEPPLI
ncbi:FxSxx-COOH system tetratricopeptide repeat protein [Hamadaea sp. NPDC051192]|uniref:FxSxx-COOH system tetratricopeptide repeat protein n=1 Tax=Hamadaea sp. NPDC051192 TaxID=3154940 RepID=UPI003442FCBB